MSRRLLIAALVAAAAPVALPGSAAADPGYVPGELLVRFKPSLPGVEVRSLLERNGAGVERNLPLVPGLRHVALPEGTSVSHGIATFEQQPDVLYAEPNWKREPFAVPNDLLFSKQWALLNSGQAVFDHLGTAGADIGATSAWDTQTGSAEVKVGVIDTGLGLSHPDLAGNIWVNPGEIPGNGIDDEGNGKVDDVNGWDFLDRDANPDDSLDPDQGHGTHIGGIIGAVANNGIGVAGVNWDVSLIAIRTPLDVAGEVAAFNYARDNGAKVVNYSAGSTQFSSSELAAINASPGVLFAVAAGNEHVNVDADPTYPCSYPSENIVCVASTSQHDVLSYFSNFGPNTVDLAAPGENILSTFPAGAISNVLIDRFGEFPLTNRWRRGGKGKKWRLTRDLGTGYSISDSPHGRYRNDTNSWIRSNAFDLSERKSCVIQFFAKVRTEPDRDLLLLEISRTGTGKWRKLRKYSGHSSRGRFATLPRRFAGDDSIYIRFRLRTDGEVRRNGAFVDDIKIGCETTTNTYAVLDGTSFSAPFVAGGAALMLAQHPGFTTGQLRSKLLASVDPLPSLTGKVASGGRLDLAKAINP